MLGLVGACIKIYYGYMTEMDEHDNGRAMGEAFVTRFDGPGPEGSIVKDMAKRAAMAAPVLIVAFGLDLGHRRRAVHRATPIAIVVRELRPRRPPSCRGRPASRSAC